jgi:hypothetical protein
VNAQKKYPGTTLGNYFLRNIYQRRKRKMKLEDQVCTTDQSVKLENLGVKKESALSWWFDGVNEIVVLAKKTFLKAYTASELMEMLPGKIKEDFHYRLKITKDIEWKLVYTSLLKGRTGYPHRLVSKNKNLAYCIANAVIWLLENNHIKAEDINS